MLGRGGAEVEGHRRPLVPSIPLLAGFLLAWRDKTPFGKDTDFVFPSVRLKGKKPLSASIMVVEDSWTADNRFQ
jgi:hypothetical protein